MSVHQAEHGLRHIRASSRTGGRGGSRCLFESLSRGGREALESNRRRAGLFRVYFRFFLPVANCSTNSLCLASFFLASLTMCS